MMNCPKNVRELEVLLRDELGKVEFWQAVEIAGDSSPDVDHEIGWAEHGRFRMLYRRSQFDRNDEPIDEKLMLLVDAPEEIREQLEAYLPMFMEAFAEDLKDTAKATALEEDDDGDVDGEGNEDEDDESYESN